MSAQYAADGHLRGILLFPTKDHDHVADPLA